MRFCNETNINTSQEPVSYQITFHDLVLTIDVPEANSEIKNVKTIVDTKPSI